jgi:tryptophan-rich sensory protein
LNKRPSESRPAKQAIGLVVFILVCFGVEAIGGLATTPKIPGWYAELAKPTWTPPGWLFGPVWTLLYLMMAVAAWLVWRQDGFAKAKWPMAAFGIQLGLNCLWSIIFFGLQRPGLAVVEILALWVAISVTVILFWRRRSLAGMLLVPYLLWVSFATALNIAIWRLNMP